MFSGVKEGVKGGRGGSGCHVGIGNVVVGVGNGKSQSKFAMFAWIWHQRAARLTGSLCGSVAVGVGEGSEP